MQHFRVSSVAVKILPDSVRVCEDLLCSLFFIFVREGAPALIVVFFCEK